MRKIAYRLRRDSRNLSEIEDLDLAAFYRRMFDRDIYLHISDVSVVMIGVCLTEVSILNVDQDLNKLNTYVDDLLAVDAFLFLVSYLMSYWIFCVMTKSTQNIERVGNLANIIFLIGMIFLTIVCGLIVWQGDYSFAKS